MGKGSKPATPNYKEAAEATAQGQLELAKLVSAFNRPTLEGPSGTQSWSLRPGADPNNPQPGDWIYSTNLSPGTQAAHDNSLSAANQQFADLIGGRDAVEQAMYGRLTKDYDRRFGAQEDALRTRLLNSGLAEGSEAWSKAMKDFSVQRNEAYADATDRSVLAGSQEMTSSVNRIAQLLAGSKGILPGQQFSQMANVQGPDYLGAASAQNKAEWDSYQQGYNELMNAVMIAGRLAIGGGWIK